MAINSNKPHLWKEDIAKSVDQFNQWFMQFAPQAYRETRIATTRDVEAALKSTNDLSDLSWQTLRAQPQVLPTLRMSTCPPLARDRLVGLASTTKGLVLTLENGRLPARANATLLQEHLQRIIEIITRMLDVDIFPWLATAATPTPEERHRASTIVADRLCGAVSDPIIRNAQEKRQLEYIESHLIAKGYRKKPHPPTQPLKDMEPGTFSFRMIVVVGDTRKVNIPIDVVIQPKKPRSDRLPILIEAKSAGDFTNTNKRRKEEATKIHQLRATCGADVVFVLFLCGYFDSGYLGYEAAEGIDWIWEHRITDLDFLGI